MGKIRDYRGKAFSIGDRDVYLRSGELQYFRIQPHLWRPAIERLRGVGFNAISTYVPWIVHEPTEGSWDFEGTSEPAANLVGFLDTCAALEMPVMIRPGPQIYAEFRGFGIPLWLGANHPDCVMRNAHGGLVKGSFYYYYSLLHPTYLTSVERWLERVTRELWPRFNGCIISYQLDNETGMPLGNTLGNFDFNPDTVKHYRHFLNQRYPNDEALRSSWRRRNTALCSAIPPTHYSHMAEANDWYAFLERWIAEYLDHLRQVAITHGVSVPFVINDLDIYLSPAAPSQKAGLAQVQGYDIYSKASGSSFVADMPFACSHDPERFRSMMNRESTFMSVEMGAGWFDPRARIDPVATVQATMGGIAHGLQGHSYYVAHDGRDPDGSPYAFHSLFDEKGQASERLGAVARVHEFVIDHEAEVLSSTACYDEVLYLTYQPYSRLLPGDYLPGHRLPDPLLYLESFGLQGLYDLFLTAGYFPKYADAGKVTSDELAAAKVVVLPTRGWLDESIVARLDAYVQQGGHLITFPTIVACDDHQKPSVIASRLYPLKVRSSRSVGYFDVACHMFSDLLVKYLLWDRWRLARREPTAMQNTDSFEGLKILLGQRLPSTPVHTSTGLTFPGDYRKNSFELIRVAHAGVGAGVGTGSDQVTIVGDLTYASECAGYTVTFPSGGSSTVIGTLPGGAYTTSAYYQMPAEERNALRTYVSSLLLARGVSAAWTSTLEIECVLRRLTANTYLAFILNRLDHQRGTLAFPRLGSLLRNAELLWTYSGSYVNVTSEREVEVTVMPQDVIVLRLTTDEE